MAVKDRPGARMSSVLNLVRLENILHSHWSQLSLTAGPPEQCVKGATPVEAVLEVNNTTVAGRIQVL